MVDGPDDQATSLIHKFLGRNAEERVNRPNSESKDKGISKEKRKLVKQLGKQNEHVDEIDEYDDTVGIAEADAETHKALKTNIPVLDFNQRVAEQQSRDGDIPGSSALQAKDPIPSVAPLNSAPMSGIVQNAFSQMRPKRTSADIATITIGSKTVTSSLGTSLGKRRKVGVPALSSMHGEASSPKTQSFGNSLRAFTAPGTQLDEDADDDEVEEEDEIEVFGNDDMVAEGDQTWARELRYAATNGPVAGSADSSDAAMTREDEDEDDDDGEVPPIALREGGSDEDYIDEEEKKAREEAKVAQMIKNAEESAARPVQGDADRARRLLKGSGRKDCTTQIVKTLDDTVSNIEKQLRKFTEALETFKGKDGDHDALVAQLSLPDECPEDRLSLAVAKEDFVRMRIIGQFNLGFILAIRPAPLKISPVDHGKAENNDEVFIIDQHASDEKYNFERLQSETTVQNQPLVVPRSLDLTAIEEEIITENLNVFEKNGFLVEVDTSGDSPVGKRCKLISLPMSREVVFNTRDLEELIALLAESPPSASSFIIPRPSKVRRMFAMRACRSSTMIGKTLTRNQMGNIVRHMGEIDKPWNCPHGRPTIRHVMGLSAWDTWREGDGVGGLEDEVGRFRGGDQETVWMDYVEEGKRPLAVGD